MKICTVDNRGRIALKKLIFNLPDYYTLEENVKGQIVLTPLRGTDAIEAFKKKDNN